MSHQELLSGIDVCLLIDEIRKALRKNDSSVPDSLGDRLFCMYLKLQYQLREGVILSCLVMAAKDLVVEASPQYRSHYEGRWIGGYVAPSLQNFSVAELPCHA